MQLNKSQPPDNSEDTKYLAPFYTFGVHFNGSLGNQRIGECPFCGKEKHFYVNKDNGKWDCKLCGKSGSIEVFLEFIYEDSKSSTTPDLLGRLAKKRNLPIRILNHFGVVHYSDTEYLVPNQTRHNEIHDIRRYDIGKAKDKLKNCPTRGANIFNLLDLINPEKFHWPIYICEGEWDAMSLYWVMEKTRTKSVVIGIPGANTFIKDWASLFVDRNVVVCYDNDEAGDNGQLKLEKFLTPVCKSVKYINWPRELKPGYDISDFIYDQAFIKNDPQGFPRCLNKLHQFAQHKPRKSAETQINGTAAVIQPENNDYGIIPSLQELIAEYSSALDINAELESLIKYMLATVISVNIQGPSPVWTFLVGPPGCGKTTLLLTLAASSRCLFQSSITATSLISGLDKPNRPDPSLIPKLNGRCLVLKDYTEILGRNQQERMDLQGILRGAFDGEADRSYGSGIYRKYKSMFSFIAGVTKEIFGHSDAEVGERFLKFVINTRGIDADKQLDTILNNIFFGGTTKYESLKLKVNQFLSQEFDFSPAKISSLLPEWFFQMLKPLGMFAAKARTKVSRTEGYERNAHEIKYMPEPEYASRITTQLAKVAIALTVLEGKPQIEEKTFEFLKRIAIDTVYGYQYIILNEIVLAHKANKKKLAVEDIAQKVPLQKETIKNYLDDMSLIGLITKHASPGRNVFTPSQDINELWSKACL